MSYGFFLSAICNTATDAIKLAIRSPCIHTIILFKFSAIDMIIISNGMITVISNIELAAPHLVNTREIKSSSLQFFHPCSPPYWLCLAFGINMPFSAVSSIDK